MSNQSPQTGVTMTSEAARAVVQTAEAANISANDAVREASTQLQAATKSLQTEDSPANRKAHTAAEHAERFAKIAVGGATERLAHARKQLEQAQKAERLAAHGRAASSVSFLAFTVAARPLATERALAARRLAEADAQAEALVQAFVVESRAVAKEGNALNPASSAFGADGKFIRARVTRPKLDYARLFATEVARARGESDATILASVWGTQIPGLTAEDALAALSRGVESATIASLLRELADAQRRLGEASKQLTTIGHYPNTRDTPLARLGAASADARELADALREIGLEASADSISARLDHTAARLLAVPALGNASGPERIGSLVAKLREADTSPVPGAVNDAQRAAGRARLAAGLIAQLETLGFSDVAARLRPQAHAATASSSAPGFLNVGA